MKTAELVLSLVTTAADHSGLDAKQILGKRREVPLCEARWACWLVMRAHGLTLQEIGRAFRRDHGTVIHGLLRAVDDHGRRNNSFRQLCEAVKNHDKPQ